jgi:hypothetical protein
MKRFKCLLLDANVVIKLFSLGLCDALVKQCEIHLSEIVVTESNFFEDSEGNRHDIDLAAHIRHGQIQIFSHKSSDLNKFRNSFDSIYLEKLDPGETESLVHLLSNEGEEFYLCSGDAIVFRVLGNLKITKKGVSLEEILDQFGWRRSLESCFTKNWRQQWSQTGLGDSMFGGGKKTK